MFARSYVVLGLTFIILLNLVKHMLRLHLMSSNFSFRRHPSIVSNSKRSNEPNRHTAQGASSYAWLNVVVPLSKQRARVNHFLLHSLHHHNYTERSGLFVFNAKGSYNILKVIPEVVQVYMLNIFFVTPEKWYKQGRKENVFDRIQSVK